MKLSFKKIEEILKCEQDNPMEELDIPWKQYLESKKEVYEVLEPELRQSVMISEVNWILRHKLESSLPFGLYLHVGDIVYLDYGQAYTNEMGYQHFGIIWRIYEGKALVIPMTSNKKQYRDAYDEVEHPTGKRHLMRLGMIDGMNKPSVVYLNDFRFINMARVIRVVAQLDVNSVTFCKLNMRCMNMLFG